ncbi:MAG TPA: hypothetical protein VF657_14625 [Actinoplanes sp.]
MTTGEHVTHDDGRGERHALELADRIRLVASQDPDLAQDLVDQLILALDRAMDGTLREHLDAVSHGVPAQPTGPLEKAHTPGVS